MPTLRFTLTWPDGATVTATASAAHRDDETPVMYDGARERLPQASDRCALSSLRAVFTHAAEVPGVRLDEWQSEPWSNENNDFPPPALGIRVLERLEDYALERLAVVSGEDGLELHGWFDGTECRLEAKPSWLAGGLLACHPLDETLALDWPMTVRVEVDGSRPQLIDNVTAEPRAVAAFRAFKEAIANGTASAGMMIYP